jgi:predicted RecA/RadA family phage recombinase
MANYTPLYMDGDRIPQVASAAIVGGQLVAVGSADNTVAPTSGATAGWLGVAGHDAASGAQVTVYTEGVHILAASGAITRGANVIAAAAGAVATIGADSSDGANIVGVALTTAANNLVTVKLR